MRTQLAGGGAEQGVLQCSVESFHDAVRLWMISSHRRNVDAKSGKGLSPSLQGKLVTSVRGYCIGEPEA